MAMVSTARSCGDQVGVSFTETLVILDFAELRQNDQTVSGVDHFQMQFASIDHLFGRCEALAAHGIVPTRSANHGPSISFYYRDPDGNRVELSVCSGISWPVTALSLASVGQKRDSRLKPPVIW